MSAVEKTLESRDSQCHLSASQRASKPLCQTHRTELVCLTCLENPPSKIEKHYTPKELAERLGCSAMTIRRRFAGAPNVIIDRATLCTGKRAYALMLIPESTVDWWINLHSCNSGEREAPPPKDSCRAGGVVNSLTSWSISENKLKERNSDSQEGVAVKRKNNKKDLRKLLNAAQGLEVESKAEDDSKPLWRLTRREREVYPLLAKQNKEISSALNITESTVKFHVGNITRKLGRSRHEILAKNWLERQ